MRTTNAGTSWTMDRGGNTGQLSRLYPIVFVAFLAVTGIGAGACYQASAPLRQPPMLQLPDTGTADGARLLAVTVAVDSSLPSDRRVVSIDDDSRRVHSWRDGHGNRDSGRLRYCASVASITHGVHDGDRLSYGNGQTATRLAIESILAPGRQTALARLLA
jgi:hypothetical protein